MIKLGLYKHSSSGRLYRVYDVQRDSEDATKFRVSYQALYDNDQFGPMEKWNRPLEMFFETVDLKDGTKATRFVFISPFTMVDFVKYYIFGKRGQ